MNLYLMIIFVEILVNAHADARPGEKLNKGMLPILIQRVDERDVAITNENAHPQNQSIVRTVYTSQKLESKWQAMKKLLDILGLQAPEHVDDSRSNAKPKKPPKYMTDLYRAIADDNGITKDPGLLDADTVRSIPNKGPPGTNVCKFDVAALNKDEVVVDAELHIFQSQRSYRKLRENNALHPHRRTAPTFSQVIKVYQLLSRWNKTSTERRLVAARRITLHHSGWHVFSIFSTVKRWIESESINHGLVTEISTSTGENINIPERETLQPLLIIFTNNTRKTNKSFTSNDEPEMETSDENLIQDEDIPIRSKRSANSRNQQWRDNRDNSFLGANRRMYSSSSTKVHSHPDDEEVNGNEGRKGFHRNIMGAEDMKNAEIKSKNGYLSDGTEYNERNTRQTQDYRSGRPSSFKSLESGTAMGNCRRYPMYVNFEDLGWGGWIIHPQGYNAYHCQGLCPFPLGAHLNPTNHATVQSIMHTLGLGAQPIEMPCCAPSKLYDINLLYFDSNDYVVLRRYKDMVAASCSCR